MGHVLFVWEHVELRARVLDPDAIVWRGNGDLPSNAARFDDTGDVLLATPTLSRTNSPSGQTAMTFWWVASLWWRMSRALGSCWSIVLLHGPTSFLWSVSPGQISSVASHHDDPVWSCHCALFGNQPRECHWFLEDGSRPPPGFRRFGPQQCGKITTRCPLGKSGGPNGPPETLHLDSNHHRGHGVQ